MQILAAIRANDEQLALGLLQAPGTNERLARIGGLAYQGNMLLRWAAEKNMYNILEILLADPRVRQYAAEDNNQALRILAFKIDGLKSMQLLLTIPVVVEHITAEDSHALRLSAQIGSFPHVKSIREKMVIDQDPDGISRAIHEALDTKQNLLVHEIHKLLGPQGVAHIKQKWAIKLQYRVLDVVFRNALAPLGYTMGMDERYHKLQAALKSVQADQVALTLFYKHSKGASIKGTTNYIEKLPNELCSKIAEYNLGELPKDPKKKHMLHLYMYASSQDYMSLVDDVVKTADRVALRQ